MSTASVANDPNQLPPQFIERLHELVSPAQTEEILAALAQPRPTTLRVNTLKANPEMLQAELSALGFELESVPWNPVAFILRSRTLRELTETPPYLDGKLYVQSLSSMIPPLVLQPGEGAQVLDVAAAPGSKTTQMAALMNNTGLILANDTSLVRLFKLQANVATQGVTNVTTRRSPGQEIWHDFPEVFDAALADVPCSMEGRFLLTKPKSWASWSPKKVKELSQRQKVLLRAAVSATKPGGVIVYSTCTMAPEENEQVVQWLLDKEGGKVVLEPVLDTDPVGLPLSPGLSSWHGHDFHPDMKLTARIWPTPLMEGFYVAKLRKLTSTLF